MVPNRTAEDNVDGDPYEHLVPKGLRKVPGDLDMDSTESDPKKARAEKDKAAASKRLQEER